MTYSYGFPPYFHDMFGYEMPYYRPHQNNMKQYVDHILSSWASAQQKTAHQLIKKSVIRMKQHQEC
jgi:hypothetical protein